MTVDYVPSELNVRGGDIGRATAVIFDERRTHLIRARTKVQQGNGELVVSRTTGVISVTR